MTELTRRCDADASLEAWAIFYGDVQVGSIGLRTGVPIHVDQWGWRCGFSPGCDPGQSSSGSASTFDQARAAFDRAWQHLLPTRTEADFQALRDHRDSIEQKRAMWARGEKLPSQQPLSMMGCPCGVRFDSHMPAETQIHAPHIYAAQRRDGIPR